MKISRSLRWCLFIVFLTAASIVGFTLAAAAQAESFVASTERFGYTGTISVYDTFADAQSGRNARYVSIIVPQRDGGLWISRNTPDIWIDASIILTNWWSNGGHNPNNRNEGFFQMYDDDASNWQNQKAFWSRDLQTFTVTSKGRNASYPSAAEPGDWARLWNAGAPQGSGESTKGTFLTYEYILTATGLNAFDVGDGFYENSTNASQYLGSFKGIFLNESLTSPQSNGYYVFDFQFNSTSWAVANGYGVDDYFRCSRVNGKVK